jgi:hypothetical protein
MLNGIKEASKDILLNYQNRRRKMDFSNGKDTYQYFSLAQKGTFAVFY